MPDQVVVNETIVFEVTEAEVVVSEAGSPGATGPAGPQGAAATVSVGSTTTLSPGSSATVSNSGTSGAAVLNFGIPAGQNGAAGSPGIVVQGVAPVDTSLLWADTSEAGSMVLPSGGGSGDVLAKASAAEYDTGWVTRSTLAADAAFTGAFAPKTATVGSSLGTSGTIDLNMATLDGTYQTISLSGNPTFTTSNRAAGRTVTVRLVAGGSSRTLAWPSWVFVGAAAPTTLASGKTAVFTVTMFDTTDAGAVAAYAAQP